MLRKQHTLDLPSGIYPQKQSQMKVFWQFATKNVANRHPVGDDWQSCLALAVDLQHTPVFFWVWN